MYSVNQAAEILNITTRAVQIKCNRHKVPKLQNEFQISEEILNVWKEAKNVKQTKDVFHYLHTLETYYSLQTN